MLTLDECIGMSGLTDDEIAVIAERRRLPAIVAVEVGHTLLETAKGQVHPARLHQRPARKGEARGSAREGEHLDRVLTQFNARHPTPRVLRT